MSTRTGSTHQHRSVIALTRADGWLRAIKLRRAEAGFELVWAKSDDDERSDWQSFADKCGLLNGDGNATKGRHDHPVVVGFDTSGVAFYTLGVPPAAKGEIASIVRLQAESRLPLPASQMQFAWRVGSSQNGELPVTMAAARTDRLRSFVNQVGFFSPTNIVLDCEGVVEAWKRLFDARQSDAVLLNVRRHETQVCRVRNGELCNAVVLDTGSEDFRAARSHHTHVPERFVQDMKSILGLFDIGEGGDLPILALSDGNEYIEQMVATLASAGFNAASVLPHTPVSAGKSDLSAEDLYDYRVPIGLASMALESERKWLDLFDKLYEPREEKRNKHWILSPRVAIAIAGAMVLLLLAVAYAVDAATPGALERRIEASLSETEMQDLIARQKLMKAVAQARPDMLALIKLVNEKGQRGIKLTSLHFNKGKPVSVSGQADNQDTMYDFQEALLEDNDVDNAVISNQTPESKGSKVNFTIDFDYKNFSTRKAAISRYAR